MLGVTHKDNVVGIVIITAGALEHPKV